MHITSDNGRPLIALGAAATIMVALIGIPATAQDRCPPPASGPVLSGVAYDEPSGFLDPSKLSRIAEDFTGCALTESVVASLLEEVNAAYAEAGADLAFAQFGSVTPGGAVTVDLVEIRYGTITVTGSEDTDAAYILRRAGVVQDGLIELDRLSARLSTLPETDDIRVTADLQPGEAVGTSDLTLDVSGPKPRTTNVTLDDDGSPETGKRRLTVVHRIASLTGLRDPISLSATRSQGATTASVGYARPVGENGTRLSGSVTIERSRFVNAQIALRNLESSSNSIALGAAIPLGAGDYGNDFLNFGLAVTDDDTDLGAVKITDQETIEISIGTSHLRREPGQSVVGASQGLRFGRLDDAVVGDRSVFLRHDATLFGALLLGENWTLSGELRSQITDSSLPSAVQFSPAGDGAVRGYPSSEAVGDGGLLTRIEMRRAANDAGFSPAVFADAGASFTRSGGELRDAGRLQSVGFLLDYQSSDRWTGSMIGAFPMTDTPTFDDAGALQISLRLGAQF